MTRGLGYCFVQWHRYYAYLMIIGEHFCLFLLKNLDNGCMLNLLQGDFYGLPHHNFYGELTKKYPSIIKNCMMLHCKNAEISAFLQCKIIQFLLYFLISQFF